MKMERTWITELNAGAAAVMIIMRVCGVEASGELQGAIVVLLNIGLRVAMKKGWI